MRSIVGEFNSIKELVVSVLGENEESRANDTLLYIECCKKLNAKTIDDIQRLNLSIISIHKARQVIQNKDGMYLPSEETLTNRSIRAKNIKAFMGELV